jgi:hypothetical protein
MRPLLIVLTATMPTSYLLPLSHLLTINSFSGNLLAHGTQNNFGQCEIEMGSFICSIKGQYVLKGLTFVSEFLCDNPSLSSVVFYNSHKQSQLFWDNLEHKVDKMKLNFNILYINGLLHETDKFWRNWLFCNITHMREADFCVFVTTNASNLGINKSSIALQMRFGWPWDLLTYFQKQGCGLWQRGTRSICVYMLMCCCMYFLSHSLSVEERTPVEVRRMELAKVRDLTWQFHQDIKSGLQAQLNMTML